MEYVLLLGDVPQPGMIPNGIPMPEWTKSVPDSYGNVVLGPSDIGYARLTGSDNPLLTDIYPDITIGRMVVNNVGEFANIVSKTANYFYSDTPEVELWEGRCLPIAHKLKFANEPKCEFKAMKNKIESYGDYFFPPTDGFMKCYGIDGATNADLKGYIESGYSIVNYFGHGERDYWGGRGGWSYLGEDWTHLDVNSLGNQYLPVIFQLACLTGMLDDHPYDCLCEYWLNKVNGGAVATDGAMRGVDASNNERECDRLWFRFIYGDKGENPGRLAIQEFGVVVYAGITEWMATYAKIESENVNVFLMLGEAFYPDVIQIYGEPSLKMRDGVEYGSFEESMTENKSLNFTPLSISGIYPNPLFSDILSIDIISYGNIHNGEMKIYDISGRLVNSKLVNLNCGINKINIDTSVLTSGVYILEVSDGENKVSSKFVKVR
ncbi:MAG: T9SS type A sorting domain-containing protein [bacterium]